MDKTNLKRYLTTVPTSVWWLSDRLAARRKKRQAKHDADAIDNLERLHRLKECGVITEKEYDELKQKLKERI